MHVLLVEPDRVQGALIVESLMRNGHTVAHGTSAQFAVQLADGQTPDLIVLELQLSQHNGVEFLYEFRSYPEWAAIPVVIYSYVSPRELAYAATLYCDLGVVRMLYKPKTSLAVLCDVVASVGIAATL